MSSVDRTYPKVDILVNKFSCQSCGNLIRSWFNFFLFFYDSKFLVFISLIKKGTKTF